MVRIQERSEISSFTKVSRIFPEPTHWESEAVFPGVNQHGLHSKLKNARSPTFTPPYTSMPVAGRLLSLSFTVFPYFPHGLYSHEFLIHRHGHFFL